MQLINPEVRIETTNFCNAKCTICPRKSFTRKQMTMDDIHFAKLVNEADSLGAKTISIFGYGEPLMDKTIGWKVGYVGVLGMESFLTTNAGLLTTDMAYTLLKASLTHIRFSVHGLWKNYEKVHRGLKFDTAMRNITNFIAINKTVFDKRCKVDVTVIPMHGETVDEIRDFWGGKVDELEIWRPHNWTDGKTYRKTKRRLKTCGRPFNGPIQVNVDGTMMICCFDYNGLLTMGDTHKSSIEDILKGDRFNEVRRKHKDGNLAGLICETCDQLNQEDDSPLLYSSIDKNINKTSSTKFQLDSKEL